MSNAHNPIKLFETVADQCPYLDDEKSASILVDPDHVVEPKLFSLLSQSGFRRSGNMLYSPQCPSCKSCVSVRIPIANFNISRSQRRVWKKNIDLSVSIENVTFKEEHFQLYLRYQKARHLGSSMCNDDPEKYINFITADYSRSKLLCFYESDKLIGISVLDQFEQGLSAVYTFFEPEQDKRSIGTFAILYLIKLAKMRKVPFVYLGYWVDRSQKMSYKRKFKPLQGYINRSWVSLFD